MTTLVANRQQAGWALWIQWILLFVGFVTVGTLATASLAQPLYTLVIRQPWLRETLIVLGLALVSATFGAVQWLLLRPYLAQAARWGATTALLVWLGSSLIQLAIASGLAEALSILVGALLFGPVCGLAQYALLRRQVQRAGWWVLAWTLGWLVMFVVAATLNIAADSFIHSSDDSLLFIYYGVGSLVSGALSGAVLVGLLRQRRRAETSQRA